MTGKFSINYYFAVVAKRSVLIQSVSVTFSITSEVWRVWHWPGFASPYHRKSVTSFRWSAWREFFITNLSKFILVLDWGWGSSHLSFLLSHHHSLTTSGFVPLILHCRVSSYYYISIGGSFYDDAICEDPTGPLAASRIITLRVG
jgi:hypothetical protein